jgi:hypothetical protein
LQFRVVREEVLGSAVRVTRIVAGANLDAIQARGDNSIERSLERAVPKQHREDAKLHWFKNLRKKDKPAARLFHGSIRGPRHYRRGQFAGLRAAGASQRDAPG